MANATRRIYNLRTRDAGKFKSSNGESGVTHATWWDGEWQKIVEAKKNRGPTKKELKKAEIRRGFQEQAKGAAAAALEYFNNKEGVEFKLLEVLGHNARFTNCVWSHVYFTAAPKSSACIDDSVKHIFAEMEGFPTKPNRFTVCTLLDPAEAVPGCGFCRRKVLHPSTGVTAGFPNRVK
ncbi:hypothetical protein OROMI_003359 [Orobanche minor]